MALQRVTLTSLETKDEKDKVEVQAQFNPAELVLTKGAQFAEIPIPGLDSPVLQFIRGTNETISLELFFDGTDGGMGEEAKGTLTQGTREGTQETVVEQVEKLYRLVKIRGDTHAPPVCKLSWGEEFVFGTTAKGATDFQCVVESVERRYLLFSPKGVPLRARVTLRLREYRTLEQQVKQIKPESRTHVHIVRRGDRVDNIAARYYGDPNEWRRLTDDPNNAIPNPRVLTPGMALVVPPIDKEDE